MTEFDQQVLALVAGNKYGRTTSFIAHKLGASPREVDDAFERLFEAGLVNVCRHRRGSADAALRNDPRWAA